ncbi:MAG: hypothetical protein COS85_02085 [Armatimonadetes bacterium CG07_land_8_20_14_0_80_59_28]|nr:MAG: hypothetical protein COS85_02085 [Armatimonadetes bacterium CG07_land_8_20_14_0_80_59_28]PIY39600.1 MAG: hypothetical protein COZ05_19030 [Armatimonadetes bacterium CG_4_10_14_3_um_filter_59_10]
MEYAVSLTSVRILARINGRPAVSFGGEEKVERLFQRHVEQSSGHLILDFSLPDKALVGLFLQQQQHFYQRGLL